LNNSAIITILILLLVKCGCAQESEDINVQICNSKFNLAIHEKFIDKPIGDVIVKIGQSFIGTEYAANTLEVNDEEQLVINFTGLDCTTLLENSLVLARCIKKGKTSFKDYTNELTFIRYREGLIEEYPSRLHYFSDWIYENEAKEIVSDISEELGGTPINFDLNFMSSHPDLYKHLSENPEFIPKVEEQEKAINERTYFFISRSELASKENLIQNGDLLAITTSVKGLDIGHVGIAVKKENGRIHLLHAPTSSKKVEVTAETLEDYLMKYKRHKGLIVLRAVEPE
jgi:hypothetical protein